VVTQAFPTAVTGNATTLQTLDGLVNIQAAMISYVDDFYLMMWVTLAAMPLALILRRPAKA
jgi:DHA2 family multidrug resistance protein